MHEFSRLAGSGRAFPIERMQRRDGRRVQDISRDGGGWGGRGRVPGDWSM